MILDEKLSRASLRDGMNELLCPPAELSAETL
jgi:hypothetical protein